MKKILLSLTLACMGMAMNSQAQVIFSQDFETPTVVPAIPSTWSQGSTGTTPWHTATAGGTTWGSLTGAYNIPSHTTYVLVDDAANPTQLHDTLKSPVFSMGSYTSVWLSYDFFFYDATNNGSGLSEHCYVLGSTNGGTSWSIIDSLYGNGWDGDSWVTGHTSLSSLSGTNCQIAFYYTDGGGAILGAALDNIQVVNLNANAAGVTAIGYNSILNKISANGEPVSFTIQNKGVTITSFDAYYTLNGGAHVSQTFSSLTLLPYQTQTFSFTTPMAGLVTTPNTLVVDIPTVNTVPNAEGTADTMASSTFTMASSEVQRAAMIEEFTSSTCPPCMSFAASFDPFCNTLNVDQPGTNINIIKYQMNWPDWDNDRGYNADGADRRTYYNCNGIPEHLVDGIVDNYNWNAPFTTADDTYFTTEFNQHAATKSFMDMSAKYYIDTVHKKLAMRVTVTPHFTKTGTYHLYVATADKHYQNRDNEWGMLDYYNSMRQMFPSGNGTAITSFTDGTPFVYTDSNVAYTNGNWTNAVTTLADTTQYPTMNGNSFWSNPLVGGTSPYTGSELLAFVEEDNTQIIMQSIVANPTNSELEVSTMSKVDGIRVYPNPTNDVANVAFNLRESGNVQVTVVDYAGHIVGDVISQNMTEGAQKVTISTEKIAAGNYLVLIQTAGGINTERITVLKN